MGFCIRRGDPPARDANLRVALAAVLVIACGAFPVHAAGADAPEPVRLRVLTTADPHGPKAHHVAISWASNAVPRLGKAPWTMSLGGIAHAGRTVLLASLGPTWRARFGRLEVSAGLSPTLLSRGSLPGKNLGSALQFTSAIGVGWRSRALPGLYLGVRAQHLSNGSIGRVNPGLNSYGVEIAYRRPRPQRSGSGGDRRNGVLTPATGFRDAPANASRCDEPNRC